MANKGCQAAIGYGNEIEFGTIPNGTPKPGDAYGNVTLNGEQALTHSRNRTVGNDFYRAERQRAVLEAMMNKLAKLGVSKLLDMSDTLLKEVRTNINVMSYVGKLTDILMNSNEYFSELTSIQIPSTDLGEGRMIDGVYYFVADPDEMRKAMIDTIYRD